MKKANRRGRGDEDDARLRGTAVGEEGLLPTGRSVAVAGSGIRSANTTGV